MNKKILFLSTIALSLILGLFADGCRFTNNLRNPIQITVKAILKNGNIEQNYIKLESGTNYIRTDYKALKYLKVSTLKKYVPSGLPKKVTIEKIKPFSFKELERKSEEESVKRLNERRDVRKRLAGGSWTTMLEKQWKDKGMQCGKMGELKIIRIYKDNGIIKINDKIIEALID